MSKMTFGRYDYAAFLSFIVYAGCSIVVPVALVDIAISLQFPLNEGGFGAGGALQLGRSFMMVLAMIYCGFAAGKFGTRQSLAFFIGIMGIGIFATAFSINYSMLFLCLAFAGIGEGAIEGLATPFVGDLHTKNRGQYINFSHAFWSVGIIITVITVGLLLKYNVNWRWIVGGIGIISTIPVTLLVLKPSKKGQKYPDRKKSVSAKVMWLRSVKILSTPRFWLYFVAMILAGGGEFGLTFWCASLIQTKFAGSAFTGGVGTALFSLGMFFGRTTYGVLIKESYLKHLIVINAAVGILIGIIFPHIDSLKILMILLFPIGIASAPFWPSIQGYAATRLRVDTTMLFILLSCAGVPGCGIFTWVMGYIGDTIGFKESFYVVPICYFFMGLLILIDWLHSNKMKHKNMKKGKNER